MLMTKAQGNIKETSKFAFLFFSILSCQNICFTHVIVQTSKNKI